MCSGEELSTLGFREGIALLREVTFGLWASQIQLQQCQEGTTPGGGLECHCFPECVATELSHVDAGSAFLFCPQRSLPPVIWKRALETARFPSVAVGAGGHGLWYMLSLPFTSTV